MWKIPCEASPIITEAIALYPTALKENTALSNLLKSNKAFYLAEKDSLSAVFVKNLQKANLKAKKARLWGNLKPTIILIGFLATYLK